MRRQIVFLLAIGMMAADHVQGSPKNLVKDDSAPRSIKSVYCLGVSAAI